MFLSVRDVAKVANVSEKTVYRWIKQGDLPAQQVGEHYRVNRAALLEWATARQIKVSKDLFQETEAPMPGLAEAIEAGGVVHDLKGQDKDQVMRSLVAAMPLPSDADRPLLLQMLLAREELASTGVGEGIAIPHVRGPIVLKVPQPLVTLCFLERPVDFGALDGQPVATLFSLISPTVRAHLHLLSRISFALRDEKFKDALARQAPREDVIQAAQRVEAGLVRPPTTQGS